MISKEWKNHERLKVINKLTLKLTETMHAAVPGVTMDAEGAERLAKSFDDIDTLVCIIGSVAREQPELLEQARETILRAADMWPEVITLAGSIPPPLSFGPGSITGN